MRKIATQGTYGVVYSFKVNKKQYVLKRNHCRDVDLTHEWEIAKELEKYPQLDGFYAKAIDIRQQTPVKKTNPKLRTHYQDLIMEHVEHKDTFYNHLPHMTWTQKCDVYYHIIEMIRTMQHYCKFVHYDLHLNNILLVVDKGGKRRYIDKQLSIKKYRPVFIDFGFSYCQNVTGFKAPLTQTHRGMTPIIFNELYYIYSIQYSLQDDLQFKIEKWPRLRISLFDILCSICNIVYGKLENVEESPVPSVSWKTDFSTSIKTLMEIQLFSTLQSITSRDVPKFSEFTHLVQVNCKNVLLFWILQFKIYYQNWLETKRTFIESCIENNHNSLK